MWLTFWCVTVAKWSWNFIIQSAIWKKLVVDRVRPKRWEGKRVSFISRENLFLMYRFYYPKIHPRTSRGWGTNPNSSGIQSSRSIALPNNPIWLPVLLSLWHHMTFKCYWATVNKAGSPAPCALPTQMFTNSIATNKTPRRHAGEQHQLQGSCFHKSLGLHAFLDMPNLAHFMKETPWLSHSQQHS